MTKMRAVLNRLFPPRCEAVPSNQQGLGRALVCTRKAGHGGEHTDGSMMVSWWR